MRPFRFVAVPAAALVVALTGCASGYSYVKSSSAHTYFRVPEDWKRYDENAVLDSEADSVSPDQLKALKASQWLTAFDSSPSPSLSHLLAATTHPAGIARVRALAPSERDSFSLATLRSELVGADPLAAANDNPNVEIVRADELNKSGGLHGSRVVFNFKTSSGEIVTVDQSTLVDSRTRTAYLFGVACEARCYDKNRRVINGVVDSWTVKEARS